MKTKDFLKKHEACCDGARWALSISKEMSDVWDAMIKEGKHAWLIWTLSRPGVFPESVLRKMACKFIRQTPLSDGRTVWDMLTDERSRKAVEVAERYADRKATKKELADARNAAYAADAAYAVSNASVYAAANSDAYTAYAAARSARAAAHAADAAYAAAHAARDAYATAYAAYSAAQAAADVAADTAYAQAKAAQIKLIAEVGNPFRKGHEDE